MYLSVESTVLLFQGRDSYGPNNNTEIESLINELDDAARDLLTQVQLTCESFVRGNSLQPEHDFKQLREILSSALITKQKIAIDKSIVQQMKGANGDSERMHNLMGDYADALQQLTKAKDMHEFKKFNATYQQMAKADCVALETSSSDTVIDPITKKPMVNPVRNIHCGHTYEKEAIESLLSMTILIVSDEADYDAKLCPHDLDKSYFGFKTSEGMCVTFSKQEGQGSYDLANDQCHKLFHGSLYNIFSDSLPNPIYRVGQPVSDQYELLFNHSLPPVDRLPIYKHELVILNGLKITRMHPTRSKKTISSQLIVQPAGKLKKDIIYIKNHASSSLNLLQSKLIIDQTEQQYLIQGDFTETICLYLETEWLNARQRYKWNVPGSCGSTPFHGFFCTSIPFQWCNVFNKTDDEAHCECSPGPEKVKCGNVPCNSKEAFVGFDASTQCVGSLIPKPRPPPERPERLVKKEKGWSKAARSVFATAAGCLGAVALIILIIIVSGCKGKVSLVTTIFKKV
ncbi:E3 SUMO-protein ligase NSE2 [Trichuris trichiura]|uniref:E3 SUMO-protein ligase NSE2 n=1 Tax=Trichuris trichiura TaxID=36087 RepID=A0A077ZHZ6_TRITR|nr:E3 SUMO-protein ligase NSE2 [Trichuris trichiura]